RLMAAPVIWYRRKRWWAVIGLVAASIAVLMLAFQPLVAWELRRRLSRLEGYETTFDTSYLRPFNLDLVLTRLKIVKPRAGGDKEPIFFSERLELGLR